MVAVYARMNGPLRIINHLSSSKIFSQWMGECWLYSERPAYPLPRWIVDTQSRRRTSARPHYVSESWSWEYKSKNTFNEATRTSMSCFQSAKRWRPTAVIW